MLEKVNFTLDNSVFVLHNIKAREIRGVAQFGRALRSGRRGRGFESRRLDSSLHIRVQGKAHMRVLE